MTIAVRRSPLRTGKLPAVHDPRTLKLADFLKAPIKLPKEYNIDTVHPGCAPHMYLNDRYGDCVMACRAEIQDRMVLEETGNAARITDAEVGGEYFAETHGYDSGLVILNSLKLWQRNGWAAGGVRRKLGAYVSVNHTNVVALQTAIYATAGQTNAGLMIGVTLTDDAMSLFQHGKPWTVTRYRPDPQEGHCISLNGWTVQGGKLYFIGITWSGYQLIAPDWLGECCDEAYLPFDKLKPSKVIDVSELKLAVAKVAA